MDFLDKIANHINVTVKSALTAYPSSKFYGISASILKVNNGTAVYLPAIVDTQGEGRWLVPDDISDISAYHKISNSTYTQLKREGYGDENGYYQHNYDMELVVMSDRRKVKISPSLLEVAIVSNMPQTISLPNVDYVNIIPVSANHSSKSIFGQEFSGESYFLKPEHILFSIRYRVELKYQKGCIRLCQCN